VTRPARIALLGLLTLPALACLIWSGSKAGWLILLGAGTVAFLHLPLRRWFKMAVALILLGAGLVGFTIKFRDYLTGGATSAVARFDYWRAASVNLRQHPLLGSGPGTFGVVYRQIKKPESEMARLAHNDYLQQGSDAGVPGLVLFSAVVLGSLVCLYRRSVADRTLFPVWLGVAALAAQGFVEFGLFIPAMAWPEFLLLGWLWGRSTAPP
jgi:O-antigen ligase